MREMIPASGRETVSLKSAGAPRLTSKSITPETSRTHWAEAATPVRQIYSRKSSRQKPSCSAGAGKTPRTTADCAETHSARPIRQKSRADLRRHLTADRANFHHLVLRINRRKEYI